MVEAGMETGHRIEIKSGLKAGEIVVMIRVYYTVNIFLGKGQI